MDAAASTGARRLMRLFYALLVVFLYAPILILALFSFNDGDPSFPLQGFTTQWYGKFFSNPLLLEALRRSAIVATASSCIAVALGIVASLALVRRRYPGKAATSALFFSPLVILGHVVVTLPYVILVIMPLLERLSISLEEAAHDLGAGTWQTFRRVTLPLLAPALFSAFLIAFTLSFDEFAIASFLVGTQPTWPVYLFAQLRVPSQLPQLIAVSSVILFASLLVVLAAEIVRRVVERRYGAEYAARGLA